MGHRQRFTKDERAQFTPGTKIEWQNGRHWQPGTVTGPIARHDITDAWYVPLENHATTRTIGRGDLIWGSPGKVRLRQGE